MLNLCMEPPHNAVLLHCSNIEKGCHSYMCDTSNRHSNCFNQFRRSPAWTPTLSCPQCRGEVINGCIVLAAVRDFMNSRPRRCSVETCEFTGNYLELVQHVSLERPLGPSVVAPVHKQNRPRMTRKWDLNYTRLMAIRITSSEIEVNFLGRLCHPNLVKLLGYCWEDQELLLVYEFMQRGSLENHLFGRVSSIEPLSWDIRLKIAVDAAKGLAFLHSPDVKVIYRDFKASNILLDGHYNAKISDFGIAKAGPSGGDSHVTTRIIGTQGYAAPEYVATGHLYVKSDVYGFGVVLLELLTGLRALDMKRAGKHHLVDWARPLLPYKSKLNLLMDAHIEGQYSSKAASLAANLTLRCLESDPKRRPSMKEVVEVLDRIVTIQGKSKPLSKSISSTSHHHHHHHHGHGHHNGSQSSHHRSPLHPSQQH